MDQNDKSNKSQKPREIHDEWSRSNIVYKPQSQTISPFRFKMMQASKINYKPFESQNQTNWHEQCKECKHSRK